MAAVVFQEEEFRQSLSGQATGPLTSWVIRSSGGLIKSKHGADRLLVFLALIILLIDFLILWRTFA